MNSIPSTNDEDIDESKSQFFIGLKKYLIFPIKAGFYGFSLVFSIILFLKLLTFLFGINEVFNLDLMDVMLSSVGFVLMFLIYILKNFH
jgi:hypothetical protein